LIHPRFELGSNEVIKMMVSQGLGVAILSQHSLNRFTHMPQIKILDVEHFPIQQQWYVAYPQGKWVSRIMKLFTDFALDRTL
jgi:LysR family transcriptional regulator, low CO2-responsive transcriptional regulator